MTESFVAMPSFPPFTTGQYRVTGKVVHYTASGAHVESLIRILHAHGVDDAIAWVTRDFLADSGTDCVSFTAERIA